ncbi:Mn2+/Fe2+ transporter, partial [Pseudomonas syringae pv. tagetis]
RHPQGPLGVTIPPADGVHGAPRAPVSVLGAVAGPIANFVPPYVLRDKWSTGALLNCILGIVVLFGELLGILINLAMWVLGVEIVRP